MNESWIGRWRSASALIGVVALIAWAVGLATQRQVAMQGFTYSYIFWVTLTLGCFALTMLHHSVRARWSMPLLRIFEAGGGAPMLIAFALMFIPIALFLGDIYPWANAAKVHGDHILEQKVIYLNPGFFIGRTAVFFAIWTLLAYLMRRSSVRQDSSGNIAESDRRANISSPGLLLFVITVTFAMTDWVMSLEPHWYSSIFGIWYVIQMGLTALAFAIIFVLLNAKRAPFDAVVDQKLTQDAGTLLFALAMFWGYITISQFIIIYAANLPESIEYYLIRTKNGWGALMTFTAIFQFFGPWTSLIAPRAKRTVGMLATISGVILIARFVDTYWIVMPSMRQTPMPAWSDFAALVGIGGIWFTVFGWQLAKAPVLANHPPKIEEAIQHA